jgi:hypothetical protein
MKINKDIRNKIAQILRNRLQENIETCHMTGNRLSLGKLLDYIHQGRKGENLQRYTEYFTMFVVSEHARQCA